MSTAIQSIISFLEAHGDFLPEGLLAEDALCFDLNAYDEALLAYVESRMDEAHQASYDG